MRCYWLKDRENQRQFKVRWERVPENDADYFTENCTTTHYYNMISRYVKDIVSHIGSYTVNEYPSNVQPTGEISVSRT